MGLQYRRKETQCDFSQDCIRYVGAELLRANCRPEAWALCKPCSCYLPVVLLTCL